jgi:hypothetical protein
VNFRLGVVARRHPVVASIAALLAVAAGAVFLLRTHVPDEWNPWAPLRLEQAPNFLTRYKLARASADDAVCRATLAQTRWNYSPIEDETTAPGCGYRNALRVERMLAAVSEPFAVSCREALSLALWERHVVQPAAQRHFGESVTRVEHFGSYSCRSVYGRPNARMSHHATADAFDVAGFVIGNDRRVRVVAAWDDEGPAGKFLRDVHGGACGFFDTVLGPEYNAAHRDHFHLDRGPYVSASDCADGTSAQRRRSRRRATSDFVNGGSDGQFKATRGCPAQHQEGGRRCKAQADDLSFVQKDTHGAGQGGREGREAQAAQRVAAPHRSLPGGSTGACVLTRLAVR